MLDRNKGDLEVSYGITFKSRPPAGIVTQQIRKSAFCLEGEVPKPIRSLIGKCKLCKLQCQNSCWQLSSVCVLKVKKLICIQANIFFGLNVLNKSNYSYY